jgi:hypothetical protein
MARSVQTLRPGDLTYHERTFCTVVRRFRKRGEVAYSYILRPWGGERWPDGTSGERGPIPWDRCSSPGGRNYNAEGERD